MIICIRSIVLTKQFVAFSGEIDGQTEAGLNGFSSASIPKEFEKNEYRLFIGS